MANPPQFIIAQAAKEIKKKFMQNFMYSCQIRYRRFWRKSPRTSEADAWRAFRTRRAESQAVNERFRSRSAAAHDSECGRVPRAK
jgi:hypothetical protein